MSQVADGVRQRPKISATHSKYTYRLCGPLFAFFPRMTPHTIDRCDPDYPAAFHRLADAPDTLHIAGRMPNIPLIGIVGSRNADAWQQRWTETFAGLLVQRGFGIISGGAAGIDTAAHRGTLEHGGITVAVMGSGFDHVYPAENKALFAQISHTGAVLTEFPNPQPPARWTFPKRNRLVAALCAALVVVQAHARSGALITARHARSLGIPVGAVPAAPGDERARGCHQLIQTGAKLIDNADDVLSMLHGNATPRQLNLRGMPIKDKHSSNLSPGQLSGDELTVWQQLGNAPIHIDELATNAGLAPQRIATAVLQLELMGYIVDTGGRCFARMP